MSNDFIKMNDNIDFSYGFIYECADLVNNLYDYSISCTISYKIM